MASAMAATRSPRNGSTAESQGFPAPVAGKQWAPAPAASRRQQGAQSKLLHCLGPRNGVLIAAALAAAARLAAAPLPADCGAAAGAARAPAGVGLQQSRLGGCQLAEQVLQVL